MLTLFALVVMRMSGAVIFNPVLGRSNYPARAKAALILVRLKGKASKDRWTWAKFILVFISYSR